MEGHRARNGERRAKIAGGFAGKDEHRATIVDSL
jgi:hypothetical protein